MSTIKEIVTNAPIYITTTDVFGIETRITLDTGGHIEINDFGGVQIHGLHARVKQGPAVHGRPRLAAGEIV